MARKIRQRGLVLIADQIRDPGNLGTIIRTASAADVDGIWLVNGTVDPFNPKVVRSSMGAVHKLPFSLVSAESCVDLCRHYGLKLIAADIKDAEPYYNSDLAQPCAVVIGNEGTECSQPSPNTAIDFYPFGKRS